MQRDISQARWWLAYPVALLLLFLADIALGFWHPEPGRLPEQFSAAYLKLYLSDVPRRKPVVAFLGDSVLWGYKIRQTDSAVAVLQQRIGGVQMLNLSYEGGSTPNSAVMFDYALRSGVHPKAVVVAVNIKEFNAADSAYRTLHPSLENASFDVLTADDRQALELHHPTDLNATLNRAIERIWRLYRLRADLREQFFGTDDMAGALVKATENLTGTAAARELGHRPTADKFLATYDLAPITQANVNMQYYLRLVRKLCKTKTPSVIFLTPTNHRLLHDYIDVPEYDANLSRLTSVPHCPGIAIVNLDRAVPARMFLDNDHLDPQGQQVLAARLLPFIRAALR